jgi:hypothetical protein
MTHGKAKSIPLFCEGVAFGLRQIAVNMGTET